MTMDQLYNKLEVLTEQGDVQKLENILQNANPSDLTDSFGMTLLHLVAKHGNVKLLHFLLKAQLNVNAQDSSGATPIIIAAKNRNFNIVGILLTKLADIFISDSKGLTLLDILVHNKINVPPRIFESIFKRLKTSGMTIENIVLMLVKSNCSLYLVLMMKEAKVTRALLERREYMGIVESCALVNHAIRLVDIDNLAVLLLYGPQQNYRKNVFLEFLCKQLLDVNADLKFVKMLLKNLVEWNFVNKGLVSTLRQIFQAYNKDDVRMLLDCGLDKLVLRKMNFDLIADLFVNNNFEASELLKNRQFDVNAQNEEGFTALQLAVVSKLEANVKFLLDSGADPNKMGLNTDKSPLMLADTERCIYLLLHYGADIFYFHRMFPISFIFGKFRNVMLAKCAYNGYHQFVERNIYSMNKDYYEHCCKQIEWTKGQVVQDSFTIYDIFSASVEYLSRFVKDEDTVSKILSTCREKELDMFYLSGLENNLNNALLMNKYTLRIANMLSEMMKLDIDHLVIKKIIGYLEFKHLLAFS